MTARTTVRTVATLVVALAVTTMFTGSAVALGDSLGGDDSPVNDSLVDDSLVDDEGVPVEVDTNLESDTDQDGGSGEGYVVVESSDGTVDTGGEAEADQSGGGGSGGAVVESSDGEAGGVGTVEADAEEPSLDVELAGGSILQGEGVSGGVDCTLDQDSAQSPQDACRPTGDLDGGDQNPEDVVEGANPGEQNPQDVVDELDPSEQDPQEMLEKLNPGEQNPQDLIEALLEELVGGSVGGL